MTKRAFTFSTMRGKFYTLLIILAFAITANAQSRYASHSLLSHGKWVKIKVKDEGVYQLNKSFLSKAGFKDPSKVKLYGYNMPMLPETQLEDLPDDLVEIPLYRKADGTALFYSCGTTQWTLTDTNTVKFTHKNNPYSSYLCYFLTEDTPGAPLEMQKNTAPAPKKTLELFPCHSLIENDEFSFLEAGRMFFESYDFATGSSRNYTIPLPGIKSSDVSLTISFGAKGNSSSTLTASSNNNTILSMSFSKIAEYQSADVKQNSAIWRNVVSAAPTLKLTHRHSGNDSGHLDYILAGYERSLEISSTGYLAFCTPDDYSYSAIISGANSSTAVWSLCDPYNAELMNGTLEEGKYTASLPSSAGYFFVATNTNSAFPSPELVGNIANQDLHSLDSIDLVIIVPSNGIMKMQAQRLADAHTKNDGTRCIVVKADEIYNEFSSGTPDITAYRRFLKMLYDKAEKASERPKNVLLFGESVWDNRLVTAAMRNRSQDNYLLCYESLNSVSHTDSYVAEEYITLLADGKGASPLKETLDCGVGRIPVNNVADAKTVVDKLIRYINNEEAGAWQNTICLLADDGNANTHGADAEAIWKSTSNIFPNYNFKKIYWDSYERKQTATGNSYPDAYNEINKTMQDGALIMNYTGHGAAYCLSHEQVLKTKDFQNWSSRRLPLWITAACDVTPFDMNIKNLGVEALLNKNGGAMGFIGTTRTVYSTPNRTLNVNFMKHVLAKKNDGTRYSIGEALAKAKSDIVSGKSYLSKNDSINKTQFVLLGDPAIVLPTPEYKVIIDKFNGNSIDQSTTISAGEIVNIEGHLVDAKGNEVNDYDGIVSATVLDCLETITCKDNDKSAAEVDKAPLTYTDRTKTIFNGSDSIRSGKFSLTFPVSMDINYSNEKGEICLYAINDSKNISAQSKFNNFYVGGTSSDTETDTIAPLISLWLNSPKFVNGGITNETPTLYVTLSDTSGINTTGSGLGHDIVAIIDNNEYTSYILNSYYSQETGNYKAGNVKFTFPALEAGKHTLTLRAFDTFNNMGETRLDFEVVQGLEEVTEIFDITGRKLQNSDQSLSLPKGVYLRRVRLMSPKGTASEHSEKLLVN